MLPTVRAVLALDAMRHAEPRVVAGARGLDRAVRWVHVSEVPDIASLLRGGELVLSTGIGLPTDDPGLRTFIGELAEVGASGFAIELGRRFTSRVPRAMVAAAESAGLPLVELHRAMPFVRITESVHAMIIDSQLAELRATEEVHQRFTELSVEGAEPAEVVAHAAALAGAPVILENLSRQVLAYDTAGEPAELLLDGWEAYSRRIRPPGRTGFDAESGWLVTSVGARGQDWGRLLIRTMAEPAGRLTLVLERAASTLALGRLIRRDAEGLERQTHRTLLSALLEHSRPVDDVVLRAKALGVVLERRHLVGVVVRPCASPELAVDVSAGRPRDRADVGVARPRDRADAGAGRPRDLTDVGAARSRDLADVSAARLRDLAEAAGAAVRDAGVTGLASALDDQTVGVLLALRTQDDEADVLGRFAALLRATAPGDMIIAAGSGVSAPREARRSLVEARQVAHAAGRDGKAATAVYRLPDVGLPGLLYLLREEPRLQTFVERELGPLLAYDAEHPREQLLGALRSYLECGRNKSAAAEASHLSRPAFYERLARIEKVSGVDLDAVDVCLSLHVALLALDAVRAF